MLQDLAALAPPAIVCAAFLVGAWVLVRRELAPKRRARRQAATAAEERAQERADHEQGASWHFTTSAIYLGAPIKVCASSVRLRTSLARVRVICQVCTHCSIRHLADTKRDPSLACAVRGITPRLNVVRTTCAPHNCVAQDVGIC